MIRNGKYAALVCFLLVLPVPALVAQGEAGKSYTVDEVLSAAQSYSLNGKLKESELRSSQAAVREAQSRLFPILDFSASASYMTDPPKGVTLSKGAFGKLPDPNTGTLVPFPNKDVVMAPDAEPTYFKTGLNLSWPLITWGKITNAIAVAESQAKIAGMQLAKDKLQTIRDVRKAYFSAKFANDSAQILNGMNALMTGVVDDMHRSFTQGLATKQDVLESESRLAGLRSQLVRANQAYRTALQGLSVLSGISPADIALLGSDYRSAPPVLDSRVLSDRVRSNSLDRGIMQENIEQAKKAVDIEDASGPFRPSLFLNVGFDVNGQKVPFTEDWTDTWNTNLTVTIGTQMGVFDGFGAAERIAQAREKLVQAGNGIALFESNLDLQVQQSIEAISNAEAARSEKQAALDLSVEREKNARVAYENELSTREEFLSAQIGTYAAKLDLVLASYQLEASLSDLEYLTGQSLQ